MFTLFLALLLFQSPLDDRERLAREMWLRQMQESNRQYEEAKKRDRVYQRKVLLEKWNDYSRKINDFMQDFLIGKTDLKKFAAAMEAWEALLKCQEWPRLEKK